MSEMSTSKIMKLGIKGLIGSGKTTVANYLTQHYQVYHYNCDLRVKAHYRENKDVIARINRELLVCDDQEINIEKLRSIVFTNKEKLLQLEGIIYPVLQAEIAEICQQHPRVLIDGQQIDKLDLEFDGMIYVNAPRKQIVSRVNKRDKRTVAEIEDILTIQGSYQRGTVDFIIENNGTFEHLFQQVDKIMEVL